jgi:FAD/FMN-containing dehydrogenase
MSFVEGRNVLSWGRVVRKPQRRAAPQFADDLPRLIAQQAEGASILPVGLLRSYGDSVLNSEGGLVAMRGLSRFQGFDPAAGTLRAEAGVSLGEIMRLVVPHGWFVPVTPGTRFVTLGGAIANDVHGKNHHRAGTFGCHVTRLGLLRGNGERIELSPESNADLFAATVGGLGLTGIIEWAEIKLAPIASSSLDVEILPYGHLDEFWQLSEASKETHEHTVAWFDCTASGATFGRGIFSRANWSAKGELVPHAPNQRLRVPVESPVSFLNRFSVNLFNRAYYQAQRRKAGMLTQHYGAFFHPLDAIGDWNRFYGRSGFWQYQCVLPPSTMKQGVADLLNAISESGQGSLLAVLKTFGGIESPGLLSFPMEGATLALDFPNRGQDTLALLGRLDSIVRAAGGRLYAAKDGRMPADMLKSGYPKLERFMSFVDPKFSSDFWRRVTQ